MKEALDLFSRVIAQIEANRSNRSARETCDDELARCYEMQAQVYMELDRQVHFFLHHRVSGGCKVSFPPAPPSLHGGTSPYPASHNLLPLPPLYLLASCCRDEDAVLAANEAITLCPKWAPGYLTLGRALLNLPQSPEHLEMAYATLQAGWRLDPDNEDLTCELNATHTIMDRFISTQIGLEGLRLVLNPTDLAPHYEHRGCNGEGCTTPLGPGNAIWESGIVLARLMVLANSQTSGAITTSE